MQIFDVKQGVELKFEIKPFGANAACVRFVNEQRSGDGLNVMMTARPNINE